MNMPNSCTIGNLRISDQELCQLDGTQLIVVVPKKEIVQITAELGNPVERPITDLIIGILLCAAGIVLGYLPLQAYIENPVPVKERLVAFKPFAYAVPLVGIGLYLIVPLFRKSYILKVITHTDTRKLQINNNDLYKVLNAASQFGYSINIIGPNNTLNGTRKKPRAL